MKELFKSAKTRALFGAVSLAALAFMAAPLPAHAAPATSVQATASARASDDFEYAGSFYWRDSCDEAGKAGIPRAWSDYYCDGSGWPWDDYDLYVKYN